MGDKKILVVSSEKVGIAKMIIEEYIKSNDLNIEIEVVAKREPKLDDVRNGIVVIDFPKEVLELTSLPNLLDFDTTGKGPRGVKESVVHTYNNRDIYRKIKYVGNAHTKRGTEKLL